METTQKSKFVQETLDKYPEIKWDESSYPKLEEIETLFGQLERGERPEVAGRSEEILKEMRESLHQNLQYLNDYSCHNGVRVFRVHLFNDFAPCSFSVVWTKDGTRDRVMQGGLIFHGSNAETFSVTIGEFKWWRVHT